MRKYKENIYKHCSFLTKKCNKCVFNLTVQVIKSCEVQQMADYTEEGVPPVPRTDGDAEQNTWYFTCASNILPHEKSVLYILI